MDTRTLCLAVLSGGPASGYEIKKELEDGVYALFCDAGFGAIYPALARLAEDGLVDCDEQAQKKRPDKKVYSLTPAGQAALAEAVAALGVRHKVRSEFMLKLCFADLLSPEAVAGALAEKRADYQEALGRVDACLAGDWIGPGNRFIAGLGQALMRAAVEYIDRHGDDLVAELDGGAPNRRVG